MLSIIICSRTQSISTDLSENINKTIGCEYELIVIDNSANQYSIFEAYNLGIDQSKGEYLCFMHDDIFIHSDGWGSTIQNIFSVDNQIGLIGVAGAKIKTRMPSAWWDCDEEHKVMNIVQHFPDKVKEHWYNGFTSNLLEEVVVIDGVFMAWRKDDGIKFNEKLKGFHNYDLHLAFECYKHQYKTVVTKNILLEHFSQGTINKDWVESTYQIHNLENEILPLSTFNKSFFRKNEYNNASNFINDCINYGKRRNALIVLFQLVKLIPISRYHFKILRKILNKKVDVL